MSAICSSFVSMTASEVFRLATASLAEIKDSRQRLINQTLEHVKNQRCTKHWFWSHQKYSSREEALEHSPEVAYARKYASTDEETCTLLLRMAKYLLNDESRSDKTIQISLEDFRALT
jgi:hypothetical protein